MDTVKPRNIFNILLAQKLIGELGKRNIEAYYCEQRSEVLKKVIELIPAGSVISCGGSASLHELELHKSLKAEGYTFLDPEDVQGGLAKAKIAHQALDVDFYLMGVNAISVTGEIVNLDGIGNRAAALSFGPKNVILFAGLNKVVPDLESAILRAKNVAAPLTMLYFKQDYASYDELIEAADKAISQMVVTRMSVFKGRIKVILVGESLGF